MITISENISLKPYNTFGIDVKARHFVAVETIDALKSVLFSDNYPSKFILGGGSNLLLTKDIDALVIHNNLKGIEIVAKNSETVKVKAAAGENWHSFVLWCLSNDFGGIENLSLIPGNVGTAPIQNIGAYGVELKDVFISCEALDIQSKRHRTFTIEDCQFDYRYSIFKGKDKGRYVITSVTLELTATNHKLKTTYGAISQELESSGIENPSIQDISNAVIKIRQSKLPDPAIIGNSGSFFKNPVVSLERYQRLVKNFPDLPFYKVSENHYKIPAGWLIETAGFKGKTFGSRW